MSVEQMPTLPLDANGVPRNHLEARNAAVDQFMSDMNDLPSSEYVYLNRTDAEWVLDNALTRYLHKLKAER